MSATSFASLFGVSKRIILRDMETLGLANIPIYAVRGVYGGYAIMDTCKLDKRLLNQTDLENVLTALSGLEQLMVNKEVEATLRNGWSRTAFILAREAGISKGSAWNGRLIEPSSYPGQTAFGWRTPDSRMGATITLRVSDVAIEYGFRDIDPPDEDLPDSTHEA